ncbi:unnamed protein product, partial [Cyprideis torosa]
FHWQGCWLAWESPEFDQPVEGESQCSGSNWESGGGSEESDGAGPIPPRNRFPDAGGCPSNVHERLQPVPGFPGPGRCGGRGRTPLHATEPSNARSQQGPAARRPHRLLKGRPYIPRPNFVPDVRREATERPREPMANVQGFFVRGVLPLPRGADGVPQFGGRPVRGGAPVFHQPPPQPSLNGRERVIGRSLCPPQGLPVHHGGEVTGQ